jgi:ATP-binding cassette, subfamily B, bacterial
MDTPRVRHRQVARFLWPYMRRHLPLLLLMVVLLLAATVATLAQPFFYKGAIDAIAGGQPGDAAVFRRAVLMILLGAGCAAVTMLCEQFASFLLGWIESRIMPRIDSDMVSRVQRLSTGFHTNSFAGATSRKIRRGVDSIEGILDRIWFNFIPAVIGVIGLTVVLAVYAPPIAVAMFIGMVLYAALSIVNNLYLARLYAWVDEQDTKINANVVDTFTGNALVKAFGTERREDTRHGSLLGEWQHRQWKTWRTATWMTLSQFLFLILIEAVVLVLAAWLWSRGEFTPGGFIVITFYVGQLWARLTEIGRNLRDYLRNMAHCEEMVGLSLQPIRVQDRPGAIDLMADKGGIELTNVGFRYEAGSRWVFRNFSVTIRPGERIALVGHSGGGKSTFVKLLFRLYDLEEGAICIDDQDIAGVTQKSLRGALSLVPQDPLLFHRSIAENIAYARPDTDRATIERAARQAHAHEFIEKLPHGYETLVGERGVKLSGGERQRVAIARAIVADRPILILDEATSSLDSVSESYIQDALDTLMEGRTSIVIAHRLSTIKKADRILVIEEGRLVEEGTHAELVAKEGGAYRRLYELQAGGFIGE